MQGPNARQTNKGGTGLGRRGASAFPRLSPPDRSQFRRVSWSSGPAGKTGTEWKIGDMGRNIGRFAGANSRLHPMRIVLKLLF